MLVWVRSLLFYACFYSWTLLIGSPVLVIRWLSPDMAWAIANRWTAGAMWLLRVICGLRYELRGLEHIPEGTVVFASKHQSAWETMIFGQFTYRPAFVLKRELLRLPIFGQFLKKVQMIAIDRSAGSDAVQQVVTQGRQLVDEGRAIVIFPEGTRTKPGATARYRRRGIVALYRELNLPVVPVALNSGLFWARNSLLKRPGVIALQCLPPIPAGLEEEEFIARLREAVETASESLRQEGMQQLRLAPADSPPADTPPGADRS